MKLTKKLSTFCLPTIIALIVAIPWTTAQGNSAGNPAVGRYVPGGGFHSRGGGSPHHSQPGGGFHSGAHGGTRNMEILRSLSGRPDFNVRGFGHPHGYHGHDFHYRGNAYNRHPYRHDGFDNYYYRNYYHRDPFYGPRYGFSATIPLGYVGTPSYYYRDYGDEVFYSPYPYRMAAPPLGAFVQILPADAVAVTVGSIVYYCSQGVFYMQQPGGFLVVSPPEGVALTALPPGATTVNINGVNHYSAYGAYYLPSTQNGTTIYTVVRR